MLQRWSLSLLEHVFNKRCARTIARGSGGELIRLSGWFMLDNSPPTLSPYRGSSYTHHPSKVSTCHCIALYCYYKTKNTKIPLRRGAAFTLAGTKERGGAHANGDGVPGQWRAAEGDGREGFPAPREAKACRARQEQGNGGADRFNFRCDASAAVQTRRDQKHAGITMVQLFFAVS